MAAFFILLSPPWIISFDFFPVKLGLKKIFQNKNKENVKFNFKIKSVFCEVQNEENNNLSAKNTHTSAITAHLHMHCLNDELMNLFFSKFYFGLPNIRDIFN